MPEFLCEIVKEGIKRPKEVGMLKWACGARRPTVASCSTGAPKGHRTHQDNREHASDRVPASSQMFNGVCPL